MTKQPDIEGLQQQIAQLQRELWRLTGRYVGPVEEKPAQTDYVAHGSDEHAALLGLKKAGEDDKFAVDGWTFEDVTAFGANARPDYIEQVLRQKVSSLRAPMPEPQSKDPKAPHFAPLMWKPGRPFSQLTE